MSDVKYWSETASSNNAAAPDGWPEGMAPSAVNNSARENMAAIRKFYANIEWREFGDATGTNDCHTIAYASGTTFTTASGDGNTTAIYHTGRRVRAVGSSTGTIYGIITGSSHSTVTTATVAWDSGSLVSESLTISLGTSVTGGPVIPPQSAAGYYLGHTGAIHQWKNGAWEVVDSVVPSGDAEFEFFHDGIDTSPGVSLIDGWEYRIRTQDLYGDANGYAYIELYENGSYRTTTGQYFLSYLSLLSNTLTGQQAATGAAGAAFFAGAISDAGAEAQNGDTTLYSLASTSYPSHCAHNSYAYTTQPEGYWSRSKVWNINQYRAATKFRLFPATATVFSGGQIIFERRYVG